MAKGSEVQAVDVSPANAGELIAAGATLVRLENSTQMAIAVQRPRDEEFILNAALKELELYPSLAAEVIYSKPVGKDDSGAQKTVEGLSIRAAESLANRWSNSAYGADLVAETDDSATIAAVFLDYESNTRHVVQKRVSKYYKSRHGQVVQYAPDRFDTVLSANQSKALREVILRSLPAGLKKEYELKARKVLTGERLPNRRKAMVEKFHSLGVEPGLIEVKMGKSIDKFTHEDLTAMIGYFNSIKDGDSSVKEVFGVDPNEGKKGPEAPSQPSLIPKG